MTARVDWSKPPQDLGTAVVAYAESLVFDALVAYLEMKGAEIVAQMKRDAPWADRTGQARRELRHAVEVDGTMLTLYLISGAPHGQYLELRWGGRYAIVSPTVPRAAIEIGNELRRELVK